MDKENQGNEVYLSEAPVLRSVFFFFEGHGPFTFDAGRLKCYSFELVNESLLPIFFARPPNDNVIVAANVVGTQNSVKFPAIGYRMRDDILEFNFGGVTGKCYVRAEIRIK